MNIHLPQRALFSLPCRSRQNKFHGLPRAAPRFTLQRSSFHSPSVISHFAHSNVDTETTWWPYMSTNLGLDCLLQVGLNMYKAGGRRRRSFELRWSPQFMTVFVVSLVCSLVTVISSQYTHAHARTCAQSDVYEHQFVTVITPVPGGESRDFSETSNLCCSHRNVIALEDFFAKGLKFRTRNLAYEGVLLYLRLNLLNLTLILLTWGIGWAHNNARK